MKKRFIYLIIVFFIIFNINACKEVPIIEELNIPQYPAGTIPLEASSQRIGDPDKGRDYLINGDYMSSGIPLSIFNAFFPANSENVLGRTGDNANLPPEFTAVNHQNGVRIATANCLSCHGSSINGQYILGLGDRNADFTADQSSLINLLDVLVEGEDYVAYELFRRGTLSIGSEILTDVVGVNPADHLFGVLASHRDKNTLNWLENDSLNFELPVDYTYVTDIPPWWHFKKKNATLANGMGRGDHAKLFMAASTLTLTDSAEAKIIDKNFVDVIAFLRTIESPPYPYEINDSLAKEGENIFNENCSACHGTYGENEFYPNLLVDKELIGTDPAMIDGAFLLNDFTNWFNTGWFGTTEPGGKLIHQNGYVAPPLDGIWASAPYLHNASVPNLYEVLNPQARKEYWRKIPNNEVYDQTKVGWDYTEETSKIDKYTYDTNKYGYFNTGHHFGNVLNDEERYAVIEYLKTL